MKTDCGGAAGMLGAFYLAVKMVGGLFHATLSYR